MVSHTIDGNAAHHLIFRIILIGFSVEITVGAAQREMTTLIACGEVNTIGLGIIHVLILSHPFGIVADNQVARSLTGRDGHQRDHILYLIIIWSKRQRQLSDGIFRTQSVVIRCLRLQVIITQVEIHTVHVLDILIMQFLRRGCLVALTPCCPQSEVTRFQHGRYLGC